MLLVLLSVLLVNDFFPGSQLMIMHSGTGQWNKVDTKIYLTNYSWIACICIRGILDTNTLAHR